MCPLAVRGTTLATSRQPIWRDFTTKKAITDAIRNVVDPSPFDYEFESELISDLIAERHWYCKHHHARPTKFKKTSGWNGGYVFWGWFDPTGWHKVSWTKCVTPDGIDDVLKQALRTAIRPIIANYKSSHSVCERCQVRATEEVDHANPTFEEMYQRAVANMGDKEKEQIMASLDWHQESEFLLPENHPVVVSVLRAHEGARLQAVCTACHQENARDRKPG